MRHLKQKKRKPTKSSRNKYKSTKKVLDIFKNKIFLIELWQLIFFSSVSILLIFTYLNQAWEPINTGQIEIKGLSGITKKDVVNASRIFFPNNLLELNPKEIEFHLIKILPIRGITVSRKFFPPGINFNVSEREPIAFASRISLNNIENGMIDIEGSWIPLKFVNQSKKDKTSIYVENWNSAKKDEITLILKNRYSFLSPLKKIKINPLQEIRIETEHFNSVLLGTNTDRLPEQINKLNQLQKLLPNLLINTKVKSVDLKDPGKPELKTEKMPSTGI